MKILLPHSKKQVKVFKNGPRKICGRQLLKNFTWSIHEYLDPNDNEIKHD